ncbi:Immunoglobulin-like domain [Sergentomyia squamirostris]
MWKTIVLILLLHSITEIIAATVSNSEEDTNLVDLGPALGEVPQNVYTTVGQTAILPCMVHNLQGDRSVSWIRLNDLHVLIINTIKFTSDPRISRQEPSPQKGAFNLVIRDVKRSDEGVYECQVSTEPKLKIRINLTVTEMSDSEMEMADSPFYVTQIHGAREEVIKVNSVVTLQCSAQHRANGTEAGGVMWLKDGRPIEKHENPRGGVSVYTEWKPHAVVSRLTLIASTLEDTGSYSCSIPGSGTDTVLLLIDDGKAERYTGGAVKRSPMVFLAIMFLCKVLL